MIYNNTKDDAAEQSSVLYTCLRAYIIHNLKMPTLRPLATETIKSAAAYYIGTRVDMC